MRTPSDAEALVALPCSPEQVPLATAIRSTTLVSSLGAVQALGLGDVYFEHLPPSHHGAMRELVAGHWQPMSLAMAHYAAVEALRLPTADARANGRRVADNVQNGHFGTMLRVLGSAVKMELVLPRFPLLVGRLLQGGACAVYKTGAHEARLELHGIPIATFDYVRAGWSGMIEGSLALVARDVRVTDCSPRYPKTSARFTVSWPALRDQPPVPSIPPAR
jgi:hypothetical protein